ncbi:hypothetical protein EBU95_17990 [bacterium]|uniref:Uncharacterized protein n=1 Tax=viral metagenome TaxID=1070528 RepID=A0A6C0EDY4_9ZZZZ|nr:hypothetical protein [bacterium]
MAEDKKTLKDVLLEKCEEAKNTSKENMIDLEKRLLNIFSECDNASVDKIELIVYNMFYKDIEKVLNKICHAELLGDPWNPWYTIKECQTTDEKLICDDKYMCTKYYFNVIIDFYRLCERLECQQ